MSRHQDRHFPSSRSSQIRCAVLDARELALLDVKRCSLGGRRQRAAGSGSTRRLGDAGVPRPRGRQLQDRRGAVVEWIQSLDLGREAVYGGAIEAKDGTHQAVRGSPEAQARPNSCGQNRRGGFPLWRAAPGSPLYRRIAIQQSKARASPGSGSTSRSSVTSLQLILWKRPASFTLTVMFSSCWKLSGPSQPSPQLISLRRKDRVRSGERASSFW